MRQGTERRRPVGLAVVALLVAPGCAGSDGDAGGAVRPAVSDAAVLADVDPSIRANPDDDPIGVWTLLDRAAGGGEPIVLVETRPDAGDPLERDRQLDDGRWLDLVEGDGERPQREVRFTGGPDGDEVIAIRSFVEPLDALVGLAEIVEIDDGAASAPGWDALGEVDFPAYGDGFTTEYDLGEDGAVFIEVHASRGDELVLARYGATEEATVDGRPAARFDAEVAGFDGFVFAVDDTMVDVRAFTRPGLLDLDDVEQIAESIRFVEAPGS